MPLNWQVLEFHPGWGHGGGKRRCPSEPEARAKWGDQDPSRWVLGTDGQLGMHAHWACIRWPWRLTGTSK